MYQGLSWPGLPAVGILREPAWAVASGCFYSAEHVASLSLFVATQSCRDRTGKVLQRAAEAGMVSGLSPWLPHMHLPCRFMHFLSSPPSVGP